MAEPTIHESARLYRRLSAAGTVRRLDMLHEALCTAYRMGRTDEAREVGGGTSAESCLEG